MWTRLFQLLLPLNTLGANPTKWSPSNADSPKATGTHLAPQLSSFAVVSKHAAQSLEEVRVDMADMKVENRKVALVTNVGSCVAICIHDPINKCGGLAHIMLPSSNITRKKTLPSKYADTAVPALTEAIRKTVKNSFCLTAKIAGGANMFPNLKSGALNIGAKNVDAVKKRLAEKGIKLLAEDVMGSYGRKVTFNVGDGSVHVRTGDGEVKKI